MDRGYEIWRLTAIPHQDPKDADKVFDEFCSTDVDAVMYNGLSVEEFYFYKAANGTRGHGLTEVFKISAAGMRMTYFKTSTMRDSGLISKVEDDKMLNVAQVPLTFSQELQ